MDENEVVVNVFWRGAGWYAPVQEGTSWECVNWEKVCDADLDRNEADEASKWQGRGTPRLLLSEEDARAFEK